MQARFEVFVMGIRQLYVLILAGGSGERFWPLSRKAKPKQLLSLFTRETLLEQTVNRLKGLVPPERILVLTNSIQEPAVRACLPQLPEENIVAEPAKRDTAAAVALGAGWIAARDSSAVMVVLPADHLIQDAEAFRKTLCTAASAANVSGELVTIGIKPTWACPGFGYIEQGPEFHLEGNESGPPVFEVKRFREKPAPDLAVSFFKQGNFRWNAGMFVWTIPAILSALERHAPELGEFVEKLHSGEAFRHLLQEVFPTLPKISIDYAVMEKADRVLMVEAAFDWDDIGSWNAVAKYLQNTPDRNASNQSLTTMDASNNIVYSDRNSHIALLGVHDMIVVQTEDAILICSRHEAEKIKNLITQIPEDLQ
jgi:mannose-1-phosphate guanylyltransferase